MTTIAPQKLVCDVCGKSGLQFVLTSTSAFGPQDLDTRPAEPARSALPAEVQQCSGCGCCAADITEGLIEEEIRVLTSPRYTEQLSDDSFPKLANRFLCQALLLEGAHEHAEAGWASLRAAWVCDDEVANEAARECRRRAVKLFHTEPPLDTKAESCLLRADLYRRIGDFEQAAAQCRFGLNPRPNQLVQRLLEYEHALVLANDDHLHTVPEEILADPDALERSPNNCVEPERMARRSGLATLSEAQELIRAELADGGWHSRRHLGKKFSGRMSDGRFLEVKKSLRIEHRRIGDRYYWRLPR